MYGVPQDDNNKIIKKERKKERKKEGKKESRKERKKERKKESRKGDGVCLMFCGSRLISVGTIRRQK